MPTSPEDKISAFFLRTGDKQALGATFHGTAYRGQHDVVRWEQRGDGRGTLRFLADGSAYKIRVERCKPSRGFDFCIVMQGDPRGVQRYQSRKRWALLPKRSSATVLDVLAAHTSEDTEIEPAFEAWLDPVLPQ